MRVWIILLSMANTIAMIIHRGITQNCISNNYWNNRINNFFYSNSRFINRILSISCDNSRTISGWIWLSKSIFLLLKSIFNQRIIIIIIMRESQGVSNSHSNNMQSTNSITFIINSIKIYSSNRNKFNNNNNNTNNSNNNNNRLIILAFMSLLEEIILNKECKLSE